MAKYPGQRGGSITPINERPDCAEICRAGQAAAQKAIADGKVVRAALLRALNRPLSADERQEIANKLNVDISAIDNMWSAMGLAMIGEAINGNVRAFAEVRDTLGEIPTKQVEIQHTRGGTLAEQLRQAEIVMERIQAGQYELIDTDESANEIQTDTEK